MTRLDTKFMRLSQYMSHFSHEIARNNYYMTRYGKTDVNTDYEYIIKIFHINFIL